MKKLLISSSAAVLAFFAPALAFAQNQQQSVNSLQSLASFVIDFINNILVPLVFAIAFLVFIFGIFLYFIAGAANDEKRAKGVKLMIYGIVGFFVMISIWGLVRILTGTLRLNNNSSANLLPEATPIYDGS